METLFFISLASGSSGNASYIGSEQSGLLIDAGIGARTIKKQLKNEGISLERAVRGVLLTHDHFDHVKGVYSLAEKFNIPIYSTAEVFEGMDCNIRLKEQLSPASRRFITKNKPFLLAGLSITPFEVPHDSADNVGFYIQYENTRFMLATDIGCITESINTYVSRSEYVVLESNYDKNMLLSGRYPFYLKERIIGQRGHLCNDESAICIARNYHPDMKAVWLCHLSRENNTPELALQAFKEKLLLHGIAIQKDLQVEVLKRNTSIGRRVLVMHNSLGEHDTDRE